MDGLPSDRRILHIAAEAAETNDKNVPLLFLGLKGKCELFFVKLTHESALGYPIQGVCF